jgi:hypothetical protein
MSRILIYMTQRLVRLKRVVLDECVTRACSILGASCFLRYPDPAILSPITEILLSESCGIAVKMLRIVVQVGYSVDLEE